MVAEVVGDEDAAIFITTAKAVVKIAAVKVAIETTKAAKPGVAIAKLGKTTVAKVAIELIETTVVACYLC